VTRFFERIGAPLVSPRAGMRLAAEQRAGRGAADVGVLLLMMWLASQPPTLVHAVSLAREMGIGAGFRSLLSALQELMPLVLGVMMGALVLSVLAGRPPERRDAETPRADAVDLAAYAIIPFVTVRSLVTFYFAARQSPPSQTVVMVIMGLAFLWSLVAWCFALIALKDRRRRDA
jgi:hypothetical protein